MSTINISLPESMRAFVEERVAKEGYGTVSEYVRALLREDQKRTARADLDAKLLAGLNSEMIEMDENYWPRVRARAMERLAKLKTEKK